MRKMKIILSLIMLPCMFAKAGKIEQLPDDVYLIKTKCSSVVFLTLYWAGAQIAHVNYNENDATLDQLDVIPEFQNQGYGSFLFKKACIDLAQKGHERMTWYAMSPGFKQQSRLNRFYEKCGAVVKQTCIRDSQDMSIDLAPYREASS